MIVWLFLDACLIKRGVSGINLFVFVFILSHLLYIDPAFFCLFFGLSSFTEDVTPEELSKILASFDPKITSLERKIASSGPVANVSAKAKKAAAALGKG